MTTDKYCPRGEIKKLEVKMWNLKFKEWRDVLGYTMVHRSVVTGRSVVLSSLCANVSEGRTEEAADIRMLMSTARRILY
ncbi:hypothetical protein Tco_0610798 [Tanacetum coccineum]